MNRLKLLPGAFALMALCGLAQAQHPAHESHASHGPHSGHEDAQSELTHVPPPPPEHPMHPMSNEAMIELMAMDDEASVGTVLVDHLEWRDGAHASSVVWEVDAWYGNDYDKLLLETEGERSKQESEGSVEALWDHVIARWWSAQLGVRHDFGEGDARTWASVGIQGLAPHWLEVEAMLFLGDEGGTAARFTGEYQLLITQQLILQPKIEANLYGQRDVERGIGSGLSDAEISLCLRYEIRRDVAPYVGLAWARHFGESADLARAAGRDVSEVQFVAGLRAWF